MIRRFAKANVVPARQESQYTCTASSLAMALQAIGISCSEKEVNEVLGCRPMKGASWDHVIAAAQHFGARCTLVCPSTLEQVKGWTDAGTPVLIGWCPEGRPWGHASVVFDVLGDGTVLVADPNIPDPQALVRTLSREEFHKKWYEPGADYLIRRTALAIEPEIVGGRSRTASRARPNNASRTAAIVEKMARRALQAPSVHEKRIFEVLRKGGVPEADAREIADALSKIAWSAPEDLRNGPIYVAGADVVSKGGRQLAQARITVPLEEMLRRPLGSHEKKLAPSTLQLAREALLDIILAKFGTLVKNLDFWRDLATNQSNAEFGDAVAAAGQVLGAEVPHPNQASAKQQVFLRAVLKPKGRRGSVQPWGAEVSSGQSAAEIEKRFLPTPLLQYAEKYPLPADPHAGPDKFLRVPALRQMVADAVMVGLKNPHVLHHLNRSAYDYYLTLYDRRAEVRAQEGEDPGLKNASLRGYALWSLVNQAVQLVEDVRSGTREQDLRWLLPLLRKRGYRAPRNTTFQAQAMRSASFLHDQSSLAQDLYKPLNQLAMDPEPAIRKIVKAVDLAAKNPSTLLKEGPRVDPKHPYMLHTVLVLDLRDIMVQAVSPPTDRVVADRWVKSPQVATAAEEIADYVWERIHAAIPRSSFWNPYRKDQSIVSYTLDVALGADLKATYDCRVEVEL